MAEQVYFTSRHVHRPCKILKLFTQHYAKFTGDNNNVICALSFSGVFAQPHTYIAHIREHHPGDASKESADPLWTRIHRFL